MTVRASGRPLHGDVEPVRIARPRSRAAPMSWDRYSLRVDREWRRKIDTRPLAELDLQRFLDAHPCLLPFAVAYTPAGTPDYGHHGTVHGAVIAQPRLPGATPPRPDFLRITRDSQWTYVTLFEPKWAGMELFRGGARFRDTYDAAREQLYRYAWTLREHHNRVEFSEAYRLPSYARHRDLMVRMVLVAGRRAELYAHPDRRDRRRREQVLIRSLDSLAPDANARDDITVRVTRLPRHDDPTIRATRPRQCRGPGHHWGLASGNCIRAADVSAPT